MIKMAAVLSRALLNERNRVRSASEEKVYKDNRLERLREETDTILLSFELLDLDHKYFNLAGTCPKGIYTMFKIMSLITKEITPERLHGFEFMDGRGTLRYHPHTSPESVIEWPDIIDPCKKDPEVEFSQIRFGKTYGGMHGLLIGNIFYVIWLDPHHNMYPDKKYGGLKILDAPGDCCRIQNDIVSEMSDEIDDLKRQVCEYEELLDKQTKPKIS